MWLPVFIYFDYSCPYSYLILPLIESVRRSVDEGAFGEQRLDVVWRPLETRPGIGAPGPPAAVEAGEPPDADWEELARRAAELGLPLYRPARTPSTHLALQASEFARDLGVEAHFRMHRAIFRAHFVRGADLGRVDTLLGLATEEGIDDESLAQAIDDGRYLEELAAAEREAESYEIAQTPTLLFGRFKVIGAAPVEVMLDAVRQASSD